MAGVRKQRQDAIRDLVRSERIRTQSDLVACLAEHGFDVTQATISRDIADLRLEKDASGIYVLPEDYPYLNYEMNKKEISRLVEDVCNRYELSSVPPILDGLKDAGFHYATRAGVTVSVYTFADSNDVAAALDASQTSGVLGSIAGDDTILVICADDAQGERFQNDVNQLLEAK